MSGFMNPQSKEKQSRFMKELGPRKPVKPKSAEQYLDDLDEQTVEHLLSIGRYVKLAMQWQTKPISYRDMIGRMYPLLGHYKSAILAELLQEADPIEAPSTASVATPERRTKAHDSVHAEYSSLFPQQPSESLTGVVQQPVEQRAELPLQGTAPQATPQAPQRIGTADEFIASIAPSAKAVAAELGIDPRIVIAQAALESGWGKSVKGNNLFGIKSHGQAGGLDVATHEVINGQRVAITDQFRAYESYDDSVRGYGDFLKENPRYQPMLNAETLEEQIAELGKSGYATDPEYADKVAAIATSKRMEDL